jgi:type IX secretion system substrate protein
MEDYCFICIAIEVDRLLREFQNHNHSIHHHSSKGVVMRSILAIFLVVCSCAGVLVARSDNGLKGPAGGVAPEIIHPTNLGPGRGASNCIGHETPLGYEISSGHNEELKLTNTPAKVTLGGTPNGPGGTFAPSGGTSFDATNQNGWIPYDAAIAAGPNHIVVCTNAQIEVYSRSGGFIARYSTDPGSGSDFFPTDAGVSFDCKAFYDNAANHFVLLYDQESNPLAFMNVAVSVTSDPTGAWYKYHLSWTLDGSTPTSNWGDFPSLGYDNNAIYIGANQYSFSGSFRYSKVRVLSKAQLYSGASATWTDFTSLLNADGSSAFTVKAGRMLSSSASEYLLNTRPGGGSSVTTWRIDNAPAAPTLTRVATVSVGTYGVPPNGRQPGGSSVASGDCRTQDVVMQNGVIYTAFSEKYGNRHNNQGAGVRYLEITTGGVKNKDISYFSSGVDRFYPAVTVDPSGNMFMVYSGSSSTQYASMYSTGKLTTETSIEAPSLIRAGAGTVTDGRWGDYSGIANDFSTTGAVWMFSGWAKSNGAWGTHVASAAFTVTPPIAHHLDAGSSEKVQAFALRGNYPNPFNPSTIISYVLPEQGNAKLSVYDILGREIATLVDGVQNAGEHRVSFHADGLPSGVYYYRLEAGDKVQAGKMLLSK